MIAESAKLISRLWFALIVASLVSITLAQPANSAENSDTSPPRTLMEQFRSEASPMVFFGAESTKLTSSARRALKEQADWILSHEGLRVRITGFGDGTERRKYNHELAMRRADSVRKYLASLGVPKGAIRIRGRLESDPKPVANRSARASVRRVETHIFGKRQMDVGGEGLVARITSWVPIEPSRPTLVASRDDDDSRGRDDDTAFPTASLSGVSSTGTADTSGGRDTTASIGNTGAASISDTAATGTSTDRPTDTSDTSDTAGTTDTTDPHPGNGNRGRGRGKGPKKDKDSGGGLASGP